MFGTVPGGQHDFARLQLHAVAAFNAFEDFLGLLPALGNDFGQLFEQGFGHGMRAVA
ncbi:MAG TPA: hypothetical protein PLQ95_11590 [Thiobacillus sp.]|nr:hypothetical protein [Thiobacillus sp.]